MTEQELKYLEVGMSVNYTEPLDESYREKAKSMIEDTEFFDVVFDNSVIWNYGKVDKIDYENNKALIKRNTFSGDAEEWRSIYELKFNDEDQERIKKIINRETTINNILD